MPLSIKYEGCLANPTLYVARVCVLQVFDFNVGVGHCVLTNPFRNATRIIGSVYTSDQVRHLRDSWPGMGHGWAAWHAQQAADSVYTWPEAVHNYCNHNDCVVVSL